MADSAQRNIWDRVIELTKEAQEKGSDPRLWAMQLSSYLNSEEVCVSLPSIELADVLVSYICWDNNVPIVWKFLDRALVLNIVPPMLVLALLSSRVIPSRLVQPAAYRLFMELLKRHVFSLKSQLNGLNYQRVMQSIDTVLQLSQIFGMQTSQSGAIVVEFIFAIVWQLLDASLDDEGLLANTSEKKPRWVTNPHDMEIDNYSEKQTEHHERMQKFNTVMAIELIGQFLQNKVTSGILNLARQNMSTHWEGFTQLLQLLATNSSALRDTKVITPEELLQFASCTHMVSRKCKLKSMQKFHDTVAIGPLASSATLCNGASHSSLWLPLDLVLEDAMDSSEINSRSAIETITCFIKVLRAIHCTTWHNTFLLLWIAALRLVQRERNPTEAPRPRLDSRLSMLLSITTLVVADLIEEEESAALDETEYGSTNHWEEKRVPGKCRIDLVSSLQMLGDYKGLLIPPQSTASAANQAAAKAMFFISGINAGNAYLECVSVKDMPTNCSGNMHHLIVEACIARNLLDTSAYFWPGYVNGKINHIPHSVPAEVSGWSSLMQGASLTPVMVNALVSSPASSLMELEKIFEIAVNGSNEEKISVAMILCGASLIRGWNLQEHTADLIVRLLSPPAPAEYSGSESHLIAYAPLLNGLILGIATSDNLEIFSLHGLVPTLACSLMSICEVFGSCVSSVLCTIATGEIISARNVFSNAFIVLLRLWKFDHCPLERRVGDPAALRPTPEYLLLCHNSHLESPGNVHQGRNKRRLSAVASSSSVHPIFFYSFPKLKAWYQQHLACVASPLSRLEETPLHQIVDELLKIMFSNICKGSQSSVHSVTSGSSDFSGTKDEDALLRLKLPAWDILEAVPFVVDVVLTACDNGKLSPREVATGLKNLSDILLASLASVISYFSAEVTRGIWKPVCMNGTDWPSPDANLSKVEEKMKKIIATTGVDFPSNIASGGSSTDTLPLPLAAFVSLTITFKASEHFLNLAGPALESLAAGCPWPCMLIVASLWTQKAKRWSDFLIFSASRTAFLQNNDAVIQLLKSCFAATLGLNAMPISSSGGGVGALLGHGLGSHLCGGISPVAPGIHYLRVYRSIKDIVFITKEIVSLLMHSVREIASSTSGLIPRERLNNKLRMSRIGMMRYTQLSLAAAMTRVKLAATLGASFVWLSGGFSLVQSLIKETLPSWFISEHKEGYDSEGMVAMLGGYALAYFALLCGTFAWGVDSTSSTSIWRPKILGIHMDFLASALDGKISLGCDWATWRAYVSGFLTIMVACTPNWVLEVDVHVLKRVSNRLRQWNEEELAVALLGIGGVGTMGAAAELIIENDM